MTSQEMLGFYASRFGAVEINNTFYKSPEATVLQGWGTQVPAHFLFAFKASQKITHIRRLKDVREQLSSLLKVTTVLQQRLGPLLFGLPPNFKKDIPRLRQFLSLLKPRYHTAWEFRHSSWFDEEVYDLLGKHNSALCIADADGDLEVPFVPTANWGYIRLRRENYNAASLKKWAKRMKEQTWRNCFVFFKHEDTARGTRFATQFLEVLGKN
jgi:uncharacterized protein YecE (DUF72 family)